MSIKTGEVHYYFQRLREIIALQLEQAAFGVFDDDELVETTPKTIRIRNKLFAGA